MFITRRAMTALDEFRQLRGDANPSVFGKTTNRWVKAATQAAGLGEGFSGHSGRVGLARAGDHAAVPGRRGKSGRVRPVAGMRGMSQPPFGAVAVLTVRYYRPQHERAVQQHGSAHGRQRTLRSAQRVSLAIVAGWVQARPGDHAAGQVGPDDCKDGDAAAKRYGSPSVARAEAEVP